MMMMMMMMMKKERVMMMMFVLLVLFIDVVQSSVSFDGSNHDDLLQGFSGFDDEEEEETASDVDGVFTFNLTSTMEWKVYPGEYVYPFERESCKERSELDFDNLISGTATRDGIWTQKGKFVSPDSKNRCPLDGTCFGTIYYRFR